MVLAYNNTFVSNKAIKVDGKKVNAILDQENLRGGAIFINCVESLPSMWCYIKLSNNSFVENYAAIQGGAISYRSAGFVDDKTNVYVENHAGVHSDTIASYASNILIVI